jgi:hypothetical protein
MGLTVGGSGINTSSMLAAPTNNSNMAMYAQDQDKGNGPGQNGEFDQMGEDLIMMNIPREGNADQLNKSTKLTLSSKKQYENHI